MISATMKRLAEKRDATKEVGEDAGFTLIELMVVLLILAILLAIAIPTFLGVTSSANDRAAQSNLNTALTSAQSVYQDQSQAFPAITDLTSSLATAEPNLTFTTGAVKGEGTISTYTDSTADTPTGLVIVASQAKSTNNCWYIVSLSEADAGIGAIVGTGTGAPGNDSTGTYYGVAAPAGGTPVSCDASAPDATTKWQQGKFPSV